MNDGFRKGKISYTVKTLTPEELALFIKKEWTDGFIAFSNSELRLRDAKAALNSDNLSGRVNGISGAEGYVMEIGVWMREGNTLYELSAEREDNKFFVQSWELNTMPFDEDVNCWHKEADTEAGSHHNKARKLFAGKLNSVEVVCRDYRLNFYITKGEE